MKILGIDYGEKRIGLAISDDSQTLARELTILSPRKFWGQLDQLISSQQISQIVLGLPLNMSGGKTEKTKEVELFRDELEQRSGLAVEVMDERLSSAMAQNLPGGKKNIDSLAAQIILQNYLDRQKNKLNFKKSKTLTGFTLIELLVVVAVIGLLASIVLVALNGARVKGRDAKRVADLAQISKALELYNNTNGFYPPTICESVLISGFPSWNSCWSTLLSPYISAMPLDPVNSASSYYWYSYLGSTKPNGCAAPIYTGSSNNYVLATHLENPANIPNACPTAFSDLQDNPLVNYIIGQ